MYVANVFSQRRRTFGPPRFGTVFLTSLRVSASPWQHTFWLMATKSREGFLGLNREITEWGPNESVARRVRLPHSPGLREGGVEWQRRRESMGGRERESESWGLSVLLAEQDAMMPPSSAWGSREGWGMWGVGGAKRDASNENTASIHSHVTACMVGLFWQQST